MDDIEETKKVRVTKEEEGARLEVESDQYLVILELQNLVERSTLPSIWHATVLILQGRRIVISEM